MDFKEIILRAITSQGNVFLCRTKEELHSLGEVATEMYPLYRAEIEKRIQIGERYLELDVENPHVCIRLEGYRSGNLSIGHSQVNYYKEEGYNVVYVSNILYANDLGDFDSGYASQDDAICLLF